MPIYDYQCKRCELEWEEYHEIDDRDNEWCSCGKRAKRLMKFNSKPVIYEYYSENLDAVITGPKQKQRIMKERDVVEAG